MNCLVPFIYAFNEIILTETESYLYIDIKFDIFITNITNDICNVYLIDFNNIIFESELTQIRAYLDENMIVVFKNSMFHRS